MNNKKIAVVDVRTPQEFVGGSVPGSVNIPMQEVVHRIDEIKAMEQPLVLCCASGNRSGQVARYLNSIGIECENAGSWMEVGLKYQIS